MKRQDMFHQQDQKRENAFSHLFRTHLAITISAMVSGRLGTMSRIEVFHHQAWIAMDSIIEVFYHLNKMLIATKHIVDNNFVFQ